LILLLLTVPFLAGGDIRLGMKSALYLLPFALSFLLAGHLLRRGVAGMWWYQVLPIACLPAVLSVTEVLYRIGHVPESVTISPDGEHAVSSYNAADGSGARDLRVITARAAGWGLRSIDEYTLFRGECHGNLGFRWTGSKDLSVSCDRFGAVNIRQYGYRGVKVHYVPTALYSFEDISADGLLQKIEEMGARRVLEVVCQDEKTWSPILDAIARGDQRWVRAGGLLFEVSDASCNILLLHAISAAMRRAPESVLALPRSQLTPAERCGHGGPEMGPLQPLEFYRETIEVLSTVEDPRLAAMRDECLEIMRAIVEP
jgi:hypothetical protein